MISPADLPLRDVHVPESVSWWPPAAGWWLLLIMVLLLVAGFILWRYWRIRRRLNPRRRARSALAGIRADYDRHGDSNKLLRDLSACLRRVALTVAPRTQVAALTGRAWLAFLDRHLPGQPFQSGAGRVLADGPYQKSANVDAEALLSLGEQAIEAMTRRRQGSD
jgi:hypothetical protein